MPHFGELTPDKLLALGFCRIATIRYTGDGALTQAIIGVGFRPKVVTIILWRDNTLGTYVTTLESQKWDTMDTDIFYYHADNLIRLADIDANHAGEIISLDADGFTVGDNDTDAFPNTLNETYQAVCWG